MLNSMTLATGMVSPAGQPLPSVKIVRDFTVEDLSASIKQADDIIAANFQRQKVKRLVRPWLKAGFVICIGSLVVAVSRRCTMHGHLVCTKSFQKLAGRFQRCLQRSYAK